MSKFAAAFVLVAAIAATPAAAKTLVFCSEGNPDGLSPQLLTTTTGMNAVRPIYNQLVEFEPGTTTIAPSLSSSVDISEDGRSYTFHLRPNVPFHSSDVFTPTRAMNADDVVFSLERQWKKDHPYHMVSGGHYDYFQDLGMPELIAGIDRLDDRTVRVRLTRPDAVFLSNMAMPFNAVMSAEYADRMLRAGTPEKVDTDPIGTGPFAFVGYQRDVAVRYRSFANYWGKPALIDTLVFSITPNPAVRLTKLKSGECQVMAFPNPADEAKIAGDPGLTLYRQESLNVGYLALNTVRKPFDDVRVRRAINMAIDKKSLVAAVYQDGGVVAKNPIPPTLWSYNPDVEDYPFDRAAAQRLLAEAGYPEGFETDLWYMPVSRPYNPNGKRVAEMIQADLGRVGIRLRLVTDEWSRYRTRLQAGEPSMALYGWNGDNADPDNFLDILLGCTSARTGGNNIARWCETSYDDLVVRAKQIPDQEERTRLYKQAQVIAKREAPWVPLAHSVVAMATRKEVTGFLMDPLARQIFERVDIEP